MKYMFLFKKKKMLIHFHTSSQKKVPKQLNQYLNYLAVAHIASKIFEQQMHQDKTLIFPVLLKNNFPS